MSEIARPFLRVGLLLLTLASMAPLCAQSLPKEAMASVELEQRLQAQLPLDLPFTDAEGHTARFGHWLGERPAVLVFEYHGCPSLCGVVLGSLVESLRNLHQQVGRDFDVLAVSIDPTETPTEALTSQRRYAQRYGRHGSEGGWHFLTGSADSIAGLTAAAGFHSVRDPVSGQYAHASGVLVVTPAGKISRVFLGVEYPPRELQTALETARQEGVGPLMQRLLLLCFHYAPAMGKYGGLIQLGLRGAGLATVAALGLGILHLQRRRRREHSTPV